MKFGSGEGEGCFTTFNYLLQFQRVNPSPKRLQFEDGVTNFPERTHSNLELSNKPAKVHLFLRHRVLCSWPPALHGSRRDYRQLTR